MSRYFYGDEIEPELMMLGGVAVKPKKKKKSDKVNFLANDK